MERAYAKQIEQKINLLLAENNLEAAYDICNDVLRISPYERKFIKIRRKIEKAAIKKNKKYIKEKLRENSYLWEEKNYREILKVLSPLMKFSKIYPKLEKLNKKAQLAYREEIKKIEEEYTKKQSERLNTILEKSADELIDELEELEINNPGNQVVRSLTQEYRNKAIRKKIEEKSELLNSRKFEAIANFIHELQKIDKYNEDVINLEKDTQKRKLESQLDDKSEYIYRGIQNIKTLMKLKKYDKAIQASEELLEVDKENKTVPKILSKAKIKHFRKTRTETAEKIREEQESLKNEFKTNPDEFIKI